MKRKAITIYHGSERIIEKPVYGAGNARKDYGFGFYCTESLDLAKEWACSSMHGGYANRYTLDLSGLKILDLTGKEYTILHWLTVLLENRYFSVKSRVSAIGKQYLIDHFSIDTSACDIIKGYRADDSYFAFAQDFLDNTITVQKLSEAMKLGRLGVQIVLKSEASFGHLSFEGYETAEQSVYYPLRKQRDELARSAYRKNVRNSELTEDDLFLADIIRGGLKADDPRIQ